MGPLRRIVRRARAAGSGGDDAGVSLAELLAYMVLSGIVLAIVGTLLVRSLVTQRDVRDQATASNAAQVVLTDMQGALRNAVSVQTPSSFNGSMLLVKTRVGDDDSQESSFECRAWYYRASTGELLTVRGATGDDAVTRGLTTTSDFSGWNVALGGVRPSALGGSDQVIFSAEGATGAQIRFEVVDGQDGSSLTIKSAAIPRPQGTSTGNDSCF